MNQQKVVYDFNCGPCDADYVGFMSRHLHKRLEEQKRSTMGNYVKKRKGSAETMHYKQFQNLKNLSEQTHCLSFEMLFIR